MSTTQTPPQTDGAGRPAGASTPSEPTGTANEPAQRRGLSGSRRTAVFIVGGVIALFVIIFGVRYLLYSLSHEGTDDAQIDADVVTVTSKISERVSQIYVDDNQPVRQGQLLLTLDNRDEQARYDQALATLNAQEAQARAAQATVTLTRDEQNAENQENEGAITSARAGIASAKDQTASQEREVSADQAAVNAANAQLKATQANVPGTLGNLQKAQADYSRDAALVATGDVSQAQLDATRAQYDSARAAYEQALSSVGAAQAQVAQSQQKLDAQQSLASGAAAQVGTQVGQLVTAQGHLAESSAPSHVTAQEAQASAAQAQAHSAAAQMETAADQLADTRIYSPINGYVGEKDVEIGQEVSPGLSLFTLIPQRVYVTANYKETQLAHMRTGQTADIHVDACPGVKLVGHIESIAPASENTFSLVPAQNATANFVKVTQRVPVRIVFDHPDPACVLRPGMSVETYVNTKS
ncbi:MAG TPA: HlyD family secretion protein [Candidatus Acidoferrales bacterium]|nr:HlyD family secretion protein [Candidatus Acidoferrales bacterium]